MKARPYTSEYHAMPSRPLDTRLGRIRVGPACRASKREGPPSARKVSPECLLMMSDKGYASSAQCSEQELY